MTTGPADHLVPVNAQPWLTDFARALETKDSDLFASLFIPDATWRDNLTFTWAFRQVYGRDSVRSLLWEKLDDAKPANIRLSTSWHEPGEVISGGQQLIEFMFDFDTVHGTNLGFIWAVPDPESPYGLRASHLYTRLEMLKGFEPRSSHPRGHGYVKSHPKQNWREHREARREFRDRDPEVLVVGGGHGGLVVAAHLERLGVDTLIIERNARIGDNWRNRYHNLALHNPVEMNHLPFLPYPDNFPQYLSKDQYADWLELYANALDLKYWTSADFAQASYDEAARRWTARTRLADGSERVLRPKHIVLATGGIGGLPYVPELAGLSSFSGSVYHSATFDGAEPWSGKRAIVVGAANSAHDVAMDLYEHGAEVTMLQRGAVTVSNVDTANEAYGDYFLGYDPDLVDLRFYAGLVKPIMAVGMKAYQQWASETDAELYERLHAVGFETTDGEDGTGWLGRFLRRGGGYYFNVGASDVVANGGIKVRQYRDVAEFVPEGVRFEDGSLLEADVVVLCTGYQNRAAELALWFDEEVAGRFDSIGPVDDTGEFANAWVPTAQPGLWFMLGGIQTARPNSPLLALGIKADLEGILPESARPQRLAGEAVG